MRDMMPLDALTGKISSTQGRAGIGTAEVTGNPRPGAGYVAVTVIPANIRRAHIVEVNQTDPGSTGGPPIRVPKAG